MNLLPHPPALARLGIHYFPDTVHFRQRDLETWLPELVSLGVSWVTLLAPAERSIPEYFLSGLRDEGIRPILHFQLPAGQRQPIETFRLFFRNYARWGVRYAVLFDRPNLRTVWHASGWAQTDLVERFLDIYLPLAEAALDEGLLPVFPPLEPGGDYWDLSFLRSSLKGIQRRGYTRLLEALVISAYACTGDRPLDWGAGGPERWPGARPYLIPPGVQDHRSFRIFDWYLAVTQQELDKHVPVLLLRAGSFPEDHKSSAQAGIDGTAHALKNLALARLLAGEGLDTGPTEPVPPEVLASNFWLLAASDNSPYASQAWFSPDDRQLPVVEAFRRWVALYRHPQSASSQDTDGERDERLCPPVPSPVSEAASRLIHHYVLLPLYAWGAADWDIQAIQPLLEQSHPTIGFSIAEACLAERVTVVGGEGAYSQESLDMLRSAGCSVERIQGDPAGLL